MATVWIAEGCLPCNACEQTAPEVFSIPEDEAVILAGVRSDGMTTTNRDERSPLLATAWPSLRAAIEEAVEGCPVEVIHFVD